MAAPGGERFGGRRGERAASFKRDREADRPDPKRREHAAPRDEARGAERPPARRGGKATADRAPATKREGAGSARPERPARAQPAANPRPVADFAKPRRAPGRQKPPPQPLAEARAAAPAPALPHTPTREPQRIAKLLARAGIASRREVERMIEDRRVALNGVPVDTPATLLTSLAGVTVDGTPVGAPAAARLFRFHKPAGVLTAERDFSGRPTIYDRLPKDLPRLIPVGRLDFNTEGLLLLTNDGELKRQLELPSSQVERTYRARAFGDVTQDQLEALITGVEIEGVRYGQIDANMERRTGRNVWIEMRLTEGKNREVRRVLEHLGLEVSRLIRTAYGPFHLGDMPPGAVDEVRQHELVEFRKGLK